MRSAIPRKVWIAAGLILALTGLTYLSTWLVSGDQMLALKSAGAVLCFLLAFAATFYGVGQLTQ